MLRNEITTIIMRLRPLASAFRGSIRTNELKRRFQSLQCLKKGVQWRCQQALIFIGRVHRLARVAKVDFIAIKPVLVEDKGRYFELKLSIDLKARYQQLGEYIKTLEELPRGVIINDIKIESNRL